METENFSRVAIVSTSRPGCIGKKAARGYVVSVRLPPPSQFSSPAGAVQQPTQGLRQPPSCSQPGHPSLDLCFLHTEEALACFCADSHLSFGTADKKSRATFLRISILKEFWQADVCFSSKSRWKDNIVKVFCGWKAQRRFHEKQIFDRVKQFSQNQSVLPHTLNEMWRAVVSGLFT